jgi:pimeloyl-ACP methyl ester carboxylesterase
MAFDDVVVLIPGFLGFSRLGGFYYFAERIAAALRCALEVRHGRAISVIPMSTLPMARLADRQDWLVRALAALCERTGPASRLHLVGHSAGGVDAQLLTCDRPLGKTRWSIHDDRVRARITTVIGIAAPHHGTCLSNAPLAKLFADPLNQFAADPFAQVALLPAVARQLHDLARLASSESNILYAAIAARLWDVVRFLPTIVRHRGLIDDLSPHAMEATRQRRSTSRAVLRSFVTVAPGSRTAEPFFQDLYRLTADTSGVAQTAPVRAAVAMLRERSAAAIRSCSDAPSFDEHANDGIVNSARQLVDPSDPDELAGIVVADHADVLGHYDRQDLLADGMPLNLGLFHSGAGFGDDQFYALYARVVEVLAHHMASA